VASMNIFLWSFTDADQSFSRFQKVEEQQLANKYTDFLKLDSAENFNTLFFGTSKIYRHLDPGLYDSVMRQNSRSYNLAMGNLFPFRLYDAIEGIIKAKKEKNIDLFIEIAPLAKVGENYDVVQIQNSLSLERLSITNSYLQSFEKKSVVSMALVETCRAIAWKYLSPTLIKKYIDAEECSTWNKNAIQKNGFVPLEIETENIIVQRYDPVDYPHPPKSEPLNGDDAFVDFVVKKASQFKNLGVRKIYFVIPPRIYRGDHVLMATMKKKLNELGFVVFDLADHGKYPEFYAADLSFDRTHLNTKGARRFTIQLANAVAEHQVHSELLVKVND
jgi:hypothetical protein